ncbi:hypothetical protein [Streptomyces apricus]|uniref:Uncharacterized protein n=1 Tax=Streptomyces apricus TaxID=1828112 RepID=A0A5B0A229_9ACTN|nr:hypothetical protein [Streptomyces apricus]KAA0923321.1 hypothetical protein FGF04_33515 [Streptomyces apricus]
MTSVATRRRLKLLKAGLLMTAWVLLRVLQFLVVLVWTLVSAFVSSSAGRRGAFSSSSSSSSSDGGD